MRFKPRQLPSGRQLNAVADQARRATVSARGGPGVGLRHTPAGIQIYDPRPPSFPARITDVDASGGAGSGCPDEGSGSGVSWYSFEELVDDGCQEWHAAPDGRTGEFTAWEANGLEAVVGDVVQMYPAPGSETYYFFAPAFPFGSGGEEVLTIREQVCDEYTGTVTTYVHTITFPRGTTVVTTVQPE